MTSNDTKKVLESIDSIKAYIMRLPLSANQAIDMLKELEAELKSHEISECSGFPNATAIPQYPYEYREVHNALDIMMKIGVTADRKKYKDLIKQLEAKLIEIYNSVSKR